MTAAPFISFKDKLAKCLLTVTLLLGMFTFSGHIGPSTSSHQEAARTERIITNDFKNRQRTCSFYQGKSSFSKSDFFTNPDKNWTNSLFSYSTLNSVKLKRISRQKSHTPVHLSFQIKRIPQNADEDLLATSLG
jgi:hypothetical protein